ncbi:MULTISPECIES: ATP-binding protein [unclassified Streptomyces]|uniref:ATP-binding protein n=1 Tax=unclassified Streptomyces TaxID=2593676 RepID=UPI002E2C7A87|nr:ATP-binding protein [Streptomyces sp. NBC_00223]
MPGGEEEPSAALPSHTSTVRSSLSGSIAHEVVQARDVHGGLHFHAPADVSPRPVPRQLPAGVHGFVDRAAESRALDRMVARRPGDGSSGARILVITGTAGVGKTSLALHWARGAHESFPDGQLYADLHGHDPQVPVAPWQVLERFLRALGTPPTAVAADNELMAAAFRSQVAGRRLLLALDNAATAPRYVRCCPAPNSASFSSPAVTGSPVSVSAKVRGT